MIPVTFAYLRIGWVPFVLPIFVLTVPIMVLIPVYLLILLLILPFNIKGNSKKIRQVAGFYSVLCALRSVNIRAKGWDKEKDKKFNFHIYVL